MVIGVNRETKLNVNLQAIKNNITNEFKILDDDIQMFAVVKANGYGHGILEVAKTALEAGATGLCVAILDEALALRDDGIDVPILVLGITSYKYAKQAADANISLTVGSVDWLEGYLDSEVSQNSLSVHLGIDTGMGRIGFRDTEKIEQAELLLKNSAFSFDGLFTHFATADQVDAEYFEKQVTNWNRLIGVIEELPQYIHVSNSATSLWHLPVKGNMIRFGVAMYGLNPSGTDIEQLPYVLEPAARWSTKLVFVKQVASGSSISYGATYTAAKDEWIGTVPIGYADGYPRCMTGFNVLIDGEKCEIVGRICMDQMMIRLPREFAVGTEVVLMGRQKGTEIGATEIAQYAGTINYEIMTGIADRVERIYR